MLQRCHVILVVFILFFSCYSELTFSQEVRNVQKAFANLSEHPRLVFLDNTLDVPTKAGHLQGVQVVNRNGRAKILISGSSAHQAYLLQADVLEGKTDHLIPLMESPFRHAGGIQGGEQFLVVGIEDNQAKTLAKVSIYDFQAASFAEALPVLSIDREGPPKRPTAGATGILPLQDSYLVVVGNWDSRDWDFYEVNLEKKEYQLLYSFSAPNDWGNYQSINLIRDKEAIYAIGFYGHQKQGRADLILVNRGKAFKPVMEKVLTKTFNCSKGVDFQTAVGLQVDALGKLHIWATQRDATAKIAVNQFSEEN